MCLYLNSSELNLFNLSVNKFLDPDLDSWMQTVS